MGSSYIEASDVDRHEVGGHSTWPSNTHVHVHTHTRTLHRCCLHQAVHTELCFCGCRRDTFLTGPSYLEIHWPRSVLPTFSPSWIFNASGSSFQRSPPWTTVTAGFRAVLALPLLLRSSFSALLSCPRPLGLLQVNRSDVLGSFFSPPRACSSLGTVLPPHGSFPLPWRCPDGTFHVLDPPPQPDACLPSPGLCPKIPR